MALASLYVSDKDAFEALVRRASALKVFDRQTNLAQVESAFCDTLNPTLASRSDAVAVIQEGMKLRTEAMKDIENRHDPEMLNKVRRNVLCAAVNEQNIAIISHYRSHDAVGDLSAKGKPSPCLTFRLVSDEDLDKAHSFYERDGHTPKHVQKSIGDFVGLGIKTLANLKSKPTMSVTFVSYEMKYEMALLFEQRALKFLLIKMVGLAKGYSVGWMTEQMTAVQADKDAQESLITDYYRDRHFETRKDPEWIKRADWLSGRFQLENSQSDRELFWLKQADAECFNWEQLLSEKYEDATWVGIGKGQSIGTGATEPDSNREADDKATKAKMDAVKEKMLQAQARKDQMMKARLARFGGNQ